MQRLARALGLVAGIGAAAVGVHSWAIASTGSALGADVSVVVLAPGELALSSSGAVVRGNGLQPGASAARGRLTLRNITGTPVRIRIRALPSVRELDTALWLRASSRGRLVARDRVGDVRTWSAGSLRLGVGKSAPLALSIRLAADAGDRVQGVIGDVSLEFDVAPVRP